ETWVGRMSLRAGIRRTSSKVRPSLANLSSRVNPPPSPGQVYRLGEIERRASSAVRSESTSPERLSSAKPRDWLEEDGRHGRGLGEVDRFAGCAGHPHVWCPG